jgi:hypothetical protein
VAILPVFPFTLPLLPQHPYFPLPILARLPIWSFVVFYPIPRFAYPTWICWRSSKPFLHLDFLV